MQQKYNIRTIEAFYALKIDIQERFFKHGINTVIIIIIIITNTNAKVVLKY